MQMPGGGSGSGSAREREWVQGAAAAPWCWGGGNSLFLVFLPGPGTWGAQGSGWLYRRAKQLWFPRWPRFLLGLITGCRVTCESSHSIRNANAGSSFSSFPCSTSP